LHDRPFALAVNSGILGAAEGLGFLAVAAGVVVLGFQVPMRTWAQSNYVARTVEIPSIHNPKPQNPKPQTLIPKH
jgi:hypothetical protein